jgi:hypothetical protein
MNKTTSFIGLWLGTLALALNLAAQERLRGFTAEGTKKQQEIERSYLAIPDAEAIREWHRYFTSEREYAWRDVALSCDGQIQSPLAY